ncbi:hypothetical protein LTR70_001959 [Exophiala xenobiotica]|uniref:Nucleoporin Pom152 n=1 Tax=Lithohypha guttulata TaxID=1690604 RepID=A0ABR0K9F5_9EURO|nr:hypothetical protein LTR24_005370 [Lithohypha guttulata]KAK5326944.1 hypothetical protein LTR70_001959 [Exophiala xenobiotica]
MDQAKTINTQPAPRDGGTRDTAFGFLPFIETLQPSASSFHPTTSRHLQPSRSADTTPPLASHTQVYFHPARLPHGKMNGTPRLRSAFPETPKTQPGFGARHNAFTPTSSSGRKRQSIIRPGPIVNATPVQTPSNRPSLIPETLIDGPTQRLYAVSFYFLLLAWKLWDYATSSGYSQIDSTFLFFKWSVLDGVYLIALTGLQIPWLEWSFWTWILVWFAHVAADGWLMYNIGFPLASILLSFSKLFYDRELSLSDTRVNAGHLVDGSGILQGKQIINLLPEGSAILNPGQFSYCLDDTTRTVAIPVQINQTTPDSIELLRYDLDTDEVETILITAKQARKLKKEADKGYDKTDTKSPRTLQYPVSKKGLYRLQKVIDQSKLEVRRRSNDAAVVACPSASISASQVDKCTGDLSGVSLHITGVPPFRVQYSKRVNHNQASSITQTVQSGEQDEPTQIVLDPKRPHMGWTQSKTLSFDINESLAQNGTWMYSIEEVTDGLQNKVVFDDKVHRKVQHAKTMQAISVHKRPKIRLFGCDAEKYLRIAREEMISMPLQLTAPGQLPASDWPLKLRYTFAPQTDGISAIEEYTREVKDEKDFPFIGKAGRYDLASIESRFCAGEVNEPSSCLVYNPPRPALNYQIEEIFDKCAGRPIGTILNFDFTGSPPFKVRYEVVKAGVGTTPVVKEFDGMRGQLEIRERSAGRYKYQIASIGDDVYSPINIRSPENTFEQNIRPPAEAYFEQQQTIKACLNSPIAVGVKLLGEGPWDLDYELIHSGKRQKFSTHTDNENLVIEVPPQTDGGKHTLVLTGVQDSSHCRTALKEERHIEIRPEQPRASFGDINGKRLVQALEGKNVKLPIKLKGLAPWTVNVQNQKGEKEYTFRDPNAEIAADLAGLYQIVSVADSCPGIVDVKADKFEVAWIKRPELHLRDPTVSEQGNRVFRKEAVCQGDEDTLGLGFSGHSPYHIKYQIRGEPIKGQTALSNKPLSIASDNAVINMDISKAGQYTYTFNELADDRYAHDRKHFAPLTVKQEVYALPSAQFTNAGKTYGYCKDESEIPAEGEYENIPITLTGIPPFSLEIAVRHHGQSPKPEMVRVREILSNSYSWTLSRASLGLGLHTVQIRAVKDARGCETLIDQNSASPVRVQVSAPPRIVPLDSRTDYCVGDHLAFSLSGQAPFDIFYRFHGKDRKARVNSHEFKRIAEQASEFVVTGVQDSVAVGGGGKCKAKQDIRKMVHPFPTVRLSHGKTLTTDIHEGGEVELVFEFTGTPPFEFTYTRSENAKNTKGRPAKVLETKSDSSGEFVKVLRASDEGTYEVVSIKDRYCAYAAPGLAKADGQKSQKLLT